MNETYKIGDKAWVATYGSKQLTRTCPVCRGNKQVTVILGNDDHVVTPCDFCRSSLGPTGAVITHEYLVEAHPTTITEIRLVQTADGSQYRYNSFLTPGTHLFPTKEEALEKALELAAARQEEEQTRAEHLKANKLKSYSWNVGYHLQAAARSRAEAERHEKLAVLCEQKDRSKKGGN